MCFQVRAQHLDAKYIKASSKCKLIEGQCYTVHCPKACMIQPEVSAVTGSINLLLVYFSYYNLPDTVLLVFRKKTLMWSLDQITIQRLRSACL